MRRSSRIAARNVELRALAIRDEHSHIQCDHEWRGLLEARGRPMELLEYDLLRVGNHSFDVCIRCLMVFVWFVDPYSGLRHYPPMEITLPDGAFVHGSMYTQVQAPPGQDLGQGGCNDRQYSTAVIEEGYTPDISVRDDPNNTHFSEVRGSVDFLTHEDGDGHRPARWAADIVD